MINESKEMPKNTLSERFSLNFNAENIEDEDLLLPDETELQRTDFWRSQRNGCWTASASKGLMTCNTKGGKMSWDNPYKVLEFSSGAIKAIYSVAKSRQRGYYIESGSGLAARYGTTVEPLIYEVVKEYVSLKSGFVEKVGFIKLPNFQTAGVSSDFLIKDELGLPFQNGEIKACTSWETHYDRCFDFLDEKGTDFWQVQMQMLAHNTNTTLYIVSEPPSNINKYIYAENIMDMLPVFKKECAVSYQEVHASPLHQKALLTRISIAEKTVQDWLDFGGNLKDILYKYIDEEREKIKDVIFISPEKTEDILKNNASKVKENMALISYDLPKEEKTIPNFSESVDRILEEPKEEIINLADLPEDFSL